MSIRMQSVAAVAYAFILGLSLVASHPYLSSRFMIVAAAGYLVLYLFLLMSPGLNAVRFFITLISVSMACLLLNTLLMAYHNFITPVFLIDHLEKTIYLQSVRAAGGILFYNDPQTMPMVSMMYQPLYQTINGFAMRLFGFLPLIPKIASFVYSIASLAVIVYFLRRQRLSTAAIIYGVFVFLCIDPPALFLMARVDTLTALLGSLVVALFYSSRTRSGYALVSVLVLLGLFTKQVFIYYYCALFLYSLFTSRPHKKTAILFFCAIPLVAMAIRVMFDSVSGGYYSFWTATLPAMHVSNPLGVCAQQTKDIALRLGLPFAMPLVLLSFWCSRIGTIDFKRLIRPYGPLLSYLGVIGGVAVPIAFLFSVKAGSSYGGYIALFPVISIASAVLFDLWMRHTIEVVHPVGLRSNFYVRLIMVAFLCAQAFMIVSAKPTYFPLYDRSAAMKLSHAEYTEIVTYLKRQDDLKKIYFARGFRSDALAHFVSESAGFQEIVIARSPHDPVVWDDEGALMDYLVAGFPLPQRITDQLIQGKIGTVVVKKGFAPFASENWYSGILPWTMCARTLYPESVREAFRRYFVREENELRYFDVYTYRPLHG